MKLKAIGAASIIALMVLAGIGIHAEAHTEDEPMEIPLYAGQDMLVGHVSVWNDGDYVYVEYNVTEENWYLSETHLHIAASMEDIPQTQGKGRWNKGGGNPIPGHFDYINESHDLYTATYTCIINITEENFELIEELYVAAHAVVYHVLADCIDIVSDNTTMVEDGNVDGATYPCYAVEAWEPGPNYPNDGPDDSGWEANSLWDQRVDYDFDAVGADWIWESYRVVHPITGDIVNFSKTFDIPGMYVISLAGMMYITCDNGYELYVNDDFVGSAQVSGDWINSDLTQAYVDTTNWQSTESFDISANLSCGTNKIFIPAVNEELSIASGDHTMDGTLSNNPGALIYYASVCYEVVDMEETAWADGEDFPGNNWATYFTYHIQPDFTTLELIYSTDMETWYGVEGSYEYGFGMGLSPNVGFYYITTNNDTLETNSPLADGYYGFYVDPTEQNLTYWNAKGVYEGCTGTWEPYMWHIINGTMPIFYLKVSNGGTDYMVLDGLQYIASGYSYEDYLRIDGDYPLGTYHYTGTITSIYGIDNTIEITITFVSS